MNDLFMMKYHILFVTCVFVYISNLFSQDRCATNEWEALRQVAQTELESRESFERWLQEQIQQEKASTRQAAQVFVIPVIVHIVHDGESVGQGTNISAQQVQSQIEVLNEDFRRKAGTPGDNSDPVGADIEIEFCMVTQDPNGNTLAEAGIHRIDRNGEGFSSPPYTLGYAGSTIQPSTFWNPEEYMNLWVMPLANDFLGFAQLPNSSNLPGLPANNGGASTDGVVINTTSFGRIGNVNGPYDRGRTTTHEVGHWMGLIHIWGDASCGNDFCDDTPQASDAHYGCPGSQFSCGSEDMIANYMDYTDDACMNLFTQDQKLRMRAVMQNALRRGSLLNSSKCGTSNLAPVANFSVSHEVICGGSQIQFSDISDFGPTTRTWLFEGGDPSTSNAAAPYVNYNQTGSFKVTLIVSNSAGTDTIIRENFIQVVDPQPTIFLEQDFESGFGNWAIDNPENDDTWELITVAGATTGDQAAYVNHYTYTQVGRRDGLISPEFDLTAYTSPLLTFEHAHRRFSADEQDSLIVYVSTDGGGTYPFRVFSDAENGSQNFATGPNSLNDFEPVDGDDWCHGANGWASCASIDLSAFEDETSVRLKFETVNDYGNNIFIDNIRLTGTCKPIRVNIDSKPEHSALKVYPNPVNDQLFIVFDTQASENAQLSLWNTVGQRVWKLDQSINPGQSEWNLPVSSYAKGIYFLNMKVGERSYRQKIIIR